MAIRLYREYRLRFYLNARHYIIINDKKGEIHPHTWELCLHIRSGRSSLVEFNTFEKAVNAFLAPYQNQLLNDIEPFHVILPTVENMVDYFAEQLYDVISSVGSELVQIEASETPTRSYILNLESKKQKENQETELAMLSELAESVLDDILG